mgnify:CR=1 FL=1
MNVAILCTVHQPSAAVYQGFDDVLVLASGRVAYFGAAAELGNYLEAIDRPLPPNANPAEYILDLVNQVSAARPWRQPKSIKAPSHSLGMQSIAMRHLQVGSPIDPTAIAGFHRRRVCALHPR